MLSWNIESRKSNGNSKFDDPLFLKTLGDRDIICLQETKGPVYLENYRSFNKNRTDSTPGGVSILVKNQLNRGITVIKSSCNRDIIAVHCPELIENLFKKLPTTLNNYGRCSQLEH